MGSSESGHVDETGENMAVEIVPSDSGVITERLSEAQAQED